MIDQIGDIVNGVHLDRLCGDECGSMFMFLCGNQCVFTRGLRAITHAEKPELMYYIVLLWAVLGVVVGVRAQRAQVHIAKTRT